MNFSSRTIGVAMASLLLASVNAFTYEPHSQLERFHNLPRIKFGSLPPGNTFALDYDYVVGAVGPGAIIIAFGVLCFLVYLISMCVCCIRSNKKGRPRRMRPRTFFGKLTSAPGIVFILALVVLGIILGAIARVGDFTDGLSSFLRAIDSVNDTVDRASNALSATSPFTDDGETYVSLTNSLTSIQSVASAQLQDCNDNPGLCPANVQTALSDLNTVIGDAVNVVNDAAAPVTDIKDNMSKVTDEVDIEDVNKKIKQAAYAVLGLMAFVLTFNYFFLCKSRMASFLFKVLIPFTLVLFALIWALSGVFYTTGLLGSDVCVAPVQSIVTLTESSSNDFVNSLNYYMRCEVEPSLTPGGAAELIDDAKTAVLDGQAKYVDLMNEVSGAGLPPAMETALEDMGQNVDDLVRTVNFLADSVFSCVSVGSIINYLIDGLCNGGIRTTILLFEILLACGVIMVLQFGFATCVCLRHPGDKSAWLEEGESDERNKVSIQMTDRNLPSSRA